MAYYILAAHETFESAFFNKKIWCYAFGDYDCETVEDERIAYEEDYDNGLSMKDLKVIKVKDSNMATIYAALSKLNEKYVAKDSSKFALSHQAFIAEVNAKKDEQEKAMAKDPKHAGCYPEWEEESLKDETKEEKKVEVILNCWKVTYHSNGKTQVIDNLSHKEACKLADSLQAEGWKGVDFSRM